MPLDTSVPNTPEWWLDRLVGRLADVAEEFDLLDDYYRGEVMAPRLATEAVRQSFRRLMSMARTNFAELVVEAVRERMLPTGFRTGAAQDPQGDQEAWRIWQANSLDADCDLVHRPMLTMGTGYVIVGPPDEEIGAPLITPEDPREVIAELDPIRRRTARAALKVYEDDAYGAQLAHLYLPGIVYRYARPIHRGANILDMSGWELDAAPIPLAVRRVPVVPFVCRADGASEISPHLGVLDRINFTTLNQLEIATLQAFRQRAITGVPEVDEDGDEIDYSDIFANDPGAMWVLPDTAKIWESGQVDLNPLRQAIQDDVRHLAAVTRTPLFYLTPDAADGSAEGAALAREGLIFKTKDRIRQTSESWEQVMSLAFEFMGDRERADRQGMEVIWSPPERYSLSEKADAATKALSGGLPWRTVVSDIWQYSPQAVDRMDAERLNDAMQTAVLAAASTYDPFAQEQAPAEGEPTDQSAQEAQPVA